MVYPTSGRRATPFIFREFGTAGGLMMRRGGRPPAEVGPGGGWSFPNWVRLAAVGALILSVGSDPPVPARSGGEPAAELTSVADRERLAALLLARQGESGLLDYRIGADDLLEGEIPDLRAPRPTRSGQPFPLSREDQVTFHRTLGVDRSGLLTLPLLGSVRAEGLTATGLEREIAARLTDAHLLAHPRPRVRVAEYRNRVVTVSGSVERPGLYALPGPAARLTDLLRAAGGPTREAGRIVDFTPAQQVAEPRPTAPPPTRVDPQIPSAPSTPSAAPASSAWLALRDLRLETAGSGRRIVLVLTRAPDRVDSFLLDEPPRLVIDLAGPGVMTHGAFARKELGDALVASVRTAPHTGSLRAVIDFSGPAVDHAIESDGARLIVRLGDTTPDDVTVEAKEPPAPDPPPDAPGPSASPGPIRLDLALLLHAPGQDPPAWDPPVRAGDVITVTPAGSVLVDGWVDRPGPYRATRGLTVSRAVAKAGGTLFPADGARVIVRRGSLRDQRAYVVDLDRIAHGKAEDIPITDGDLVRVPANRARLVPWSVWRAMAALF